jgi:hypothetical protein
MTIAEVLPTLKALNHKDKIRVIQFLANEVAREEGITFEESKNAEMWSLHNSHGAATTLQKLLDEDQTN